MAKSESREELEREAILLTPDEYDQVMVSGVAAGLDDESIERLVKWAERTRIDVVALGLILAGTDVPTFFAEDLNYGLREATNEEKAQMAKTVSARA